MRCIVASIGLCLLLIYSLPASAAPSFPPLTGRVVDNAHILSQPTIQSLDQQLAGYENGTSNQVVVATIASLNGDSIDDYGYQLGRYWGIGQKGKDNGVLLIVAPHERKVRIEVGYGLEPVLTDAASSEIVNQVILPDFRAGHMEQGVVDGTQAILSVLGGKPLPAAAPTQYVAGPFSALLGFILTLVLLILPFIVVYYSPSFPPSRFGSSRMGGYSSGGFSSGGFSGGGFSGGGFSGFSGGGGSFGGGGASGSW